MKDNNRHLLYGLMAMALEFDCYGQDTFSQNFWKRISEDNEFSLEQILKEFAQVIPRLLEDKEQILEYRDFLKSLPFSFMPLQPMSSEDLEKIIEYSREKIKKYKSTLK